jgi:aspartyl/glutamyl-tRNA(Asn/Gln) amidotransferase C subunit
MATKFTPADVSHIAGLATIPVAESEKQKLADGFTTTVAVIEKLNDVDTSKAKTEHMTGLMNVTREDTIDESRMFSQEQALANAPRTYNGYFVVDRLIDEE